MQGYSIYQHSSVCHTFLILPSRVTSWRNLTESSSSPAALLRCLGIDHPSEVYVPGAPQNSIQNLVCHALLFTYWASARVPWYATSKCIVFSDVWDPVLVCQAHLPGTCQVVTSTGYHTKVSENWPYFTYVVRCFLVCHTILSMQTLIV